MEREFDVYSWWRRNCAKYPILSEQVKDVLAIHVSYVVFESAFIISGRISDLYRSSLTSYMIEALVCTQPWLQNNNYTEKLARLVQMFEELDFHESLGKYFTPSFNTFDCEELACDPTRHHLLGLGLSATYHKKQKT